MEKLLESIADKLVGLRCQGVEVVDVSSITPLSEYYIVATSRSAASISGAISGVTQVLKENNCPIHHIEYRSGALWCLIDCSSFIIHIFVPGERARMRFDEIYAKCPKVTYGEEEESINEKKEDQTVVTEIDTWR